MTTLPDDTGPSAEHSPEALELWRDLCEKDDRTSPEEYPDMALITQDEFCSTLDRFRAAGVREERERCLRVLKLNNDNDAHRYYIGHPEFFK